LLGDEGSGYAIAVAGLRAAVRAADGRGPPTELTERLQRLLGADTPAAFIDLVYDPAMTRQRIAALAATVFEAAPSDEVARGIIDFAAAELAELVRALTARLDFSASRYLLALAGGVLLNQPRLRELLLVHLQDRGAAPASVALVSDPARGALLLARLAAASSTGKGDL
jgi:N-acetylglucosamine kinase-like BadF-type ATPase